MQSRHPLFYMFSRRLWNKNANPVTAAQRAAMMSAPALSGMTLAKIAKIAKVGKSFEDSASEISGS
jgi:hypothetical protein